jgi:hypothetical protein
MQHECPRANATLHLGTTPVLDFAHGLRARPFKDVVCSLVAPDGVIGIMIYSKASFNPIVARNDHFANVPFSQQLGPIRKEFEPILFWSSRNLAIEL